MDGSNKALNFLRKYMMLIVTVLVVIAFYFITGGKTLNPDNIDALISQNAYVFILGTGMLLCILTGGNIDLSVGSVICLAGGVGAIILSALSKTFPMLQWWPVTVLAMLVMGLIVGVWHGFWIAYVKVPPFIATLVGMLAFRGLANIIMQGKDVMVEDQTYLDLFGGGDSCYVPDLFEKVGPELVINGNSLNKTCVFFVLLFTVVYVLYTFINRIRLIRQGYKVDNLAVVIIKTVLIAAVVLWFGYKLSCYRGIPTALIWIGLILGLFAYITTKTTLGRNLYAIGGNEKATRLSGIDTRKVMFSAYALMGILSGFAAIMVIARGKKAGPTIGDGYEMDAIAACFIGGASAYGGTGSIGGVIIGALMMGVINQGMDIMGTSSNYKLIVKGLVLMLAVFFDVVMKMRKKGGAKA